MEAFEMPYYLCSEKFATLTVTQSELSCVKVRSGSFQGYHLLGRVAPLARNLPENSKVTRLLAVTKETVYLVGQNTDLGF